MKNHENGSHVHVYCYIRTFSVTCVQISCVWILIYKLLRCTPGQWDHSIIVIHVQTLISKNLNFCKGIDLCIYFNKAMRFQIAINMQQIWDWDYKSYLCLQVMKIRTKIPGLHHPQMVLPSRSGHATCTFVFNPHEKKNPLISSELTWNPPKTNPSTYEYFLIKNVCTKFTLTISSNRKYFFTPGVSKLFFC